MRWHRSCVLVEWLAITAVALATTSCRRHHQPGLSEPDPPRPVDVVRVEPHTATDSLVLLGETEPWREATLYFEVPGVIDSLSVEEGELVETDAPLAQLELTDFRLAVEKAQAELASAAAQLALLRAGTRQEDLEAARAKYQQSLVRSDFWQKELARVQRLFEDEAAGKSEVEQARRESDAARQAVRAAKAELDRAVAGPRSQELDRATADVQAARTALALKRRQLSKATLKAPFPAGVERRFVDPGDYVNVFPTGGVPIVRLVDLSQVDALVSVPEVRLDEFSVGQRIQIISATDSLHQADAKVTAIGRVADSVSGTYSLRARFQNPQGRFTGGMVIKAVVKQDAGPTIQIPVTAVGHAYGEPPYVMLVTGNPERAEARSIEMGPVNSRKVTVTEGLSGGELLIVRGQHAVVPGDLVDARLQEAPTGGPAARNKTVQRHSHSPRRVKPVTDRQDRE